MKISIVTTLYRTAQFLDELYDRSKKVALEIADDYEFVIVDDGSPDDSEEALTKLADKDDKVKAIIFSRNFGHHKALNAGLKAATGDYIFMLDSDLEEQPELMLKFWDEIQKDPELDVVYGIQEERKGKFVEKYIAVIFYHIFNIFSDIKLPKNLTMARLMSRRFVDSFLEFEEYHPVFAALTELTGFKKKSIFVKKGLKGFSSYNLLRKLTMIVNSITSFSIKPLWIVFYFGLFSIIISSLFILRLLWQALFYNIEIGYPSIIISIWFFGGILLSCLGIIGIYVAKVFEQVKQRPKYIIKKKIN